MKKLMIAILLAVMLVGCASSSFHQRDEEKVVIEEHVPR